MLAAAAVVSVAGFGAARMVLGRIDNLQQQEDPEPNQYTGPPEVVFVLGGPGSGKGTMCAKIVQDFGFVHLSAGDLLRAERKSGSELGDMIEEYIQEGKIVPAEVTVRLLDEAMAASPNKRFLIDGFPRNVDNVECWEQRMAHCNVNMVLVLDCPEKVMEARLLRRGESSGRSDDNIASIRKRFVTFEQVTMPVIFQYQSAGKVKLVMADRSVDEVYADVRKAFEEAFPQPVLPATVVHPDTVADLEVTATYVEDEPQSKTEGSETSPKASDESQGGASAAAPQQPE